MNVAQRALTVVIALPVAVGRRAGEEAVSIWHDAQVLTGNGRASQVSPAGVTSSSAESLSTSAKSISTPAGPNLPTPSAQKVYFAWYGGLGAMTVLRFIEWRLAAVVAVAHTVERYGHRQRVREFVEGLDSGF